MALNTTKKVLLLLCFLTGVAIYSSTGSQDSTPGATTAEFSVNGNGGAVYTIPIEVPPGTHGVEPQISLRYNSQNQVGLAGAGFDISGVSAITRCPATTAQDGFIGAITFGDDDRFCMDGSRLMAVDGDYGGDGTTYYTERQSWSKIVSHYGEYDDGGDGDKEACGGGPCYFEVTTKKGITQLYGTTTDSRIEAQGKDAVLVWALYRTVDLHGNYIEYSYDENQADGNYQLDTIAYTGNTDGSLDPAREITFNYEDRPDVSVKYIGGSLFE